jgi:hypothetical protein
MTTFKDVLCLLAIFIAYGIVGRLDYEDAVRMEQIRQERRFADCLTAATPADRETLTRIDDPSLGSLSRCADGRSPNDDQPRAPRVS